MQPVLGLVEDAALSVMNLAYRESVQVVPGLAESLFNMLTKTAPEALAVAWALNFLGRSWRPSAAELDRIAAIVDPNSDAQVAYLLAGILADSEDKRAVDVLVVLLEDTYKVISLGAAEALGEIGAERAVDPLIAKLGDSDSAVRQAALRGLSWTCENEIDRKLLSRDLDGINPFLDPQEEIDESRVREASEVLELPPEEVRHRYEALCKRFPLKLAFAPDA